MAQKFNLEKRHKSEKRFRLLGFSSLIFALLCLVMLLLSIVLGALPAMWQTQVKLDVYFDPASVTTLNENGEKVIDPNAAFSQLLNKSLYETFPSVTSREARRELRTKLLSSDAPYQLRNALVAHPAWVGTSQSIWLTAHSDFDLMHQGYYRDEKGKDESVRVISDNLHTWHQQLLEEHRIKKVFNTGFYTHSASRDPQTSGIKGALIGSFYALMITLLLSFPVAVLSAVYLEEFAPKNHITSFIEANINNLAAVPSIVFGLLGLSVFIQFFGMPRSSALVGGLVLSLMSLPTMIISSRAALKAVPQTLREAAIGLGASKMQSILHQVLPNALPGIMTGTILAMAQALGETAPLLMIGMVAFIVDVPTGVIDPATVLPVQIFMWSDFPERGFTALTSYAILILLIFLVCMNMVAILVRNHFERRN